jgi:hypothetical protein
MCTLSICARPDLTYITPATHTKTRNNQSIPILESPETRKKWVVGKGLTPNVPTVLLDPFLLFAARGAGAFVPFVVADPFSEAFPVDD